MSNKLDISHLAKLANLPLNDQEKEEFAKDVPQILKYVDQIKELKAGKTPPTNQVTQETNRFREDSIMPSLSQDEALSQAKSTHNGYFVVKAVIDHES